MLELFDFIEKVFEQEQIISASKFFDQIKNECEKSIILLPVLHLVYKSGIVICEPQPPRTLVFNPKNFEIPETSELIFILDLISVVIFDLPETNKIMQKYCKMTDINVQRHEKRFLNILNEESNEEDDAYEKD